ncbi:MAG TPA: ATP-binding cassette domain-containing protein [bacterium]|nr:ATP-binding cassette domain-containing protein [bacterium]
MSETVVDILGAIVKRGANVLLDVPALEIRRGEFVGVIGPNGAGKTTLLNVIAGFERFEGKLRLFGRDAGMKRARATRLRIGYVPQYLNFDPAFPILAREAVMTGAAGRIGLFRSPGREECAKGVRLLEMMRIEHLAARPLGSLSGGERQKISLARALIQEPEILLLDEPTAGLDIAVQKEFLALIREIHRSQGLTVLYVTHDFNMIPNSMTRALLLMKGEIAYDGRVAEALSSARLSSLFGSSLESFERNGARFISHG